MQATSKDLRIHTRSILEAAMRGEEVIITFHGKPSAKIVPLSPEEIQDRANQFCGMWADRTDLDDIDAYVRPLRKGRFE